jgi:hypothetical protein
MKMEDLNYMQHGITMKEGRRKGGREKRKEEGTMVRYSEAIFKKGKGQ